MLSIDDSLDFDVVIQIILDHKRGNHMNLLRIDFFVLIDIDRLVGIHQVERVYDLKVFLLFGT